MPATRLVLLIVGLALVAAPACAPRRCVPEHLAKSRNLIDLNLPPDAHAPVSPTLIREVADEFRRRGDRHPPGSRPYNCLALSGGGLYGAFGVGVLSGWTEAGTRPCFDVVTGISTGALMATFAFLGPEYDDYLRDQFVRVDRREILRLRFPLAIPFSNSLFASRPMERRIDDALTPEVLGGVARAHAAGRRLYIGTTNLDTRGLIIWDMGAIAARGTPEARRLYRDVIRASSAIPGAIPPVRLPVEIDGARYEELHVDGGVSDEVIFRAFMVADLNRAAGLGGSYAPTGSALYVVSNGKLYSDPSCVRPGIIPMLSASGSSILHGKTRDEMYRIYLNCLTTGMDFRLTAVPRELRLSGEGSLELSPDDQERLYDEGRRIGRAAPAGEGWRDDPPGTDPAEQALPRAGTRFATPR